MDPEHAIALLNEHGFEVSTDDVYTYALADLRPRFLRNGLSISMIDYVRTRGEMQGEPTGRAYLRLKLPFFLRESFEEAYNSVGDGFCSFLGDRHYRPDDYGAYHISVTAPRMLECWMAGVPETNDFKRAVGTLDIAASPGYGPPKIEILELLDKRLFIKPVPSGMLSKHRYVLDDLFVYTKTAFSFHGYISRKPLETTTAIDILNTNGFDVSPANVRQTNLMPNPAPASHRRSKMKRKRKRTQLSTALPDSALPRAPPLQY